MISRVERCMKPPDRIRRIYHCLKKACPIYFSKRNSVALALLLLPLGRDNAIEPPEARQSLKEKTSDPRPPQARSKLDTVPLKPRAVEPIALAQMDSQHGQEDGLDQPPIEPWAAGERGLEEGPDRRTGQHKPKRKPADKVERNGPKHNHVKALRRRKVPDGDVAVPQRLLRRARHIHDGGPHVLPRREGRLELDEELLAAEPAGCDGHAFKSAVLEPRRRGGGAAEAGVVAQVEGELTLVVAVHVRHDTVARGGCRRGICGRRAHRRGRARRGRFHVALACHCFVFPDWLPVSGRLTWRVV